jgi:hypothetical protein
MSRVEALEDAIFGVLLADFVSRHLTVNDLSASYVGVDLAMLTQKCCEAAEDASPVDFDVALNALEDGDFVNTGPLEVTRAPGRVGLFSKREYVYLTEKGYKAASKKASKRTPPPPAPQVHISGSTFHQSPIGIGSNVTQSVTATFGPTTVFRELRDALVNVPNEDDRAKLHSSVDAMEAAHKTPNYVDRYAAFMQLAVNHMKIITPFIPALTDFLTSHHH